MHDHLLTTEQTTDEGTLKVLDRPTDSNQQGRACAIRAAGEGGADRVCAPCPPALTGGESQNKDEDDVKVDWCTVTWKPEPDEVLGLNIHALLIRLMGDVVGAEVPGMLGYATGFKFYQLSYGALISVGRLDYGGECHQGRARLDLSGTGCAQVENWLLLQSEIAAFPAVKLTRVDLAYDSIDGAFGVEDAFDWYLQGEFNAGGRNPRYSTPGDWGNPSYATGEGLRYGRTFEVGRRENGKMLRSYEKGRQLGDSTSPWTRFEVEIRNIDRDIPLDILTDRQKYFVGAYDCLQRLINSAPQKIATYQKEGEISLERFIYFASIGYGKLIQVLRTRFSPEEIIQILARPGLPRRLEKSILSGFNAQSPPGARQKKKRDGGVYS
ncbi:MAG: hypothetical protein D4R39_01750 [Methylophilaceae bacterium]|nr:MAG: hypothetical protein D4R39_01750 [Methylophilaceae bacterium]